MKHGTTRNIFFTLFLSLFLTVSFLIAFFAATEPFSAHAAAGGKDAATLENALTPSEVTSEEPSAPSPPVIASSIVKAGIQVTWNSVSDADGYYVMRKVSGGTWKRLADVSADSLQDSPDALSDHFTYTDQKVTEGKNYHYAVKSYRYSSDSGKLKSAYSNKLKIKYTLPPQLRLSVTSAGVSLSWAPRTGASGYYVYRKASGDADWTLAKKLSAGNIVAWMDKPPTNGTYYHYAISSYSGGYESILSPKANALWLKSPAVKLARSSRSMTVTWSKCASVDGYEVQYASNGFFIGKKTQKFSGNSTVSTNISGLSKKNVYFARVRTYQVHDGKTYYSDWGLSPNAKGKRTVKASALYTKVKVTTKDEDGKKKKKTVKKTFELRSKAKLSMYGYDTVQGSCTNGKYAYFAMNNRKTDKCRIVKVNISKKKVVKVSPVLNIGHGNGMTFVKGDNRIAVVHKSAGKNRVTFINAKSLRISSRKNVKIPDDLPGATNTKRKNISSFSAIAYDSNSKRYVALVQGTTNFLILDKNLNPLCYIMPSFKNAYLNQGLDVTKDYIILSQSPNSKSQKYNIFSVYTWDGIYIRTINVKKGYELESAFHSGSKFYAGVYRSYNQAYYKRAKKTVVKNGKKVAKMVKVRRWRLMRDNYVYRLSGF